MQTSVVMAGMTKGKLKCLGHRGFGSPETVLQINSRLKRKGKRDINWHPQKDNEAQLRCSQFPGCKIFSTIISFPQSRQTPKPPNYLPMEGFSVRAVKQILSYFDSSEDWHFSHTATEDHCKSEMGPQRFLWSSGADFSCRLSKKSTDSRVTKPGNPWQVSSRMRTLRAAELWLKPSSPGIRERCCRT